MTITFSDQDIDDPRLFFDDGVAAIDIITLRQAGDGVTELGLDLQLPVEADIVVPPVFDMLCVVEVEPDGTVCATIDTKKMTWGLGSDEVWQKDFTDYTGTQRYGVQINDRPVSQVDGLVVTNVPTKLGDGSEMSLWFAEVPKEQLDRLSYYELFRLAGNISRRFVFGGYFDWITVPAQQIRWQRRMAELLPANPGVLKDVVQRVFMALDETGVRIKAVTEMYATGVPDWDLMRSHIFGAQHPVIMWLTEPDSTIPFAVIATTSQAWLDPDSGVSFDDSAFSW